MEVETLLGKKTEPFCGVNTDLKRLLPRHGKILDLHLAGFSRKEIAEALGLTVQTISNVTNSPLFQDEYSRRKSSVDKKKDEQLACGPVQARAVLDKASVDAAEKLHELVHSCNEGIAQRASVAILDKVLGGDKDSLKPIVINAEMFQLLQVSMDESSKLREIG